MCCKMPICKQAQELLKHSVFKQKIQGTKWGFVGQNWSEESPCKHKKPWVLSSPPHHSSLSWKWVFDWQLFPLQVLSEENLSAHLFVQLCKSCTGRTRLISSPLLGHSSSVCFPWMGPIRAPWTKVSLLYIYHDFSWCFSVLELGSGLMYLGEV